jgi:phosphohistidine swiveling domain-containing protein
VRHVPIIQTYDVDELIEKYQIHPPFIEKALPAHFYTVDFVQQLWNGWGDYAGFYYRFYVFEIRNGYLKVLYFADEQTALRNHYFSLLEKDAHFLEKHYVDWSESCRPLEVSITDLEQALKENNFSQILKNYKAFAEAYLFEYSLSAPVQEAFGFQPELWINPEIEAYCEKHGLDLQSTFTLLTSPIVLSFIAEEELELLKLALWKKPAQDNQDAEYRIRLAAHQKKWFWLRNNYLTIETQSESFFDERMAAFEKRDIEHLQDEITRIENSPKKKQEEKEQLLALHTPSDKLGLYIRINEKFAEMQDVRKAFVLRANHYHKLFLQRVSEELFVPLEELWFYAYQEVLEAIEQKHFLPSVVVEKRRQAMFIGKSKDEQVILAGEEASVLIDRLEKVRTQETDIRGLVAYKGKVTGVVKIVLRVEDLSKVEVGDVMVSSMTRPEMTGAMQRAAAFVTDEGGITCHAAIIARELKKPCIIGTKVATKLLKDGDLVEVDANAGIVRIIS